MNKNFQKKKSHKKQRLKSRLKTSWVFLIFLGLIVSLGIIPLRLAMTLYYVPTPQAILMIGGNDYDRPKIAAQLARSHPILDVWISDIPQQFSINQRFLQEAGISESRVHYDFCATDTVTNFTCTVKKFVEKDLHYLYLVTSDYHMTRARAIATLVFGSRGIAVTPVSVASKADYSESPLKILRDCIRSLVWIVTGRTGASYNSKLTTEIPISSCLQSLL